jgi:hypothetical protein
MPIRFKCPNPVCRKPLVVKDHLGGKKAACPACKKPLTVPTLVAPPANIEDFAAAALADAPATADAGDTGGPIRLECPFCAEPVEFAANLAGKQAPCPNPECRRIVKVPVPAKAKATDWRQAGLSGPMGTRENVQKAVEAQQAANVRIGRVSLEALEEAGALPIEQELVTTADKVKRWIRRVAVTALAVAVIALSWSWLTRKQQESREKEALTKVRQWLDQWSKLDAAEAARLPEEEREALRLQCAELHRALGSFLIRDAQNKKTLDQARLEFLGARAEADHAKASPQRDLILADLALSQIDLGGTDEEIASKVRMKWDDVQTELSRTLGKISSREGQLFALREVVSALLVRGQKPVAIGLAIDMSKSAALLTSQQVAALLATNGAADAAAILKAPDQPDARLDLATRLGYAEGRARQGDFPGARKLALEKGVPLDRLQAALGVAAVALQARNNTEAAVILDDIFGLLGGELKEATVPPLLLWQAARVAAWAGTRDQVKVLVGRIQDADCASRAELEDVYSRLDLAGEADPDLVTNKKTLAYGQALELLARARTRQGSSDVIMLMMDGTEERLRPFLYAGIALGEKDRR